MGSYDLSLYAIAHIAGALFAGGAIGIERTVHGRAAGFRTYALVCMGSAIAMTVTTYPQPWIGTYGISTVAAEPTRIMQGILTGIGFLGAGVIVKEGFSVRGLTTAASIWTTAAIGILIGMRYYIESVAAVLLVLGTLSTFRWIEDRMAQETYARVALTLRLPQSLAQADILALVAQAGLRAVQISYGFDKTSAQYEYELVVASFDPASLSRLAALLEAQAGIAACRIAPMRD
jgi:putative Mg2+ transporter-C (MgtC) family protein